MTKKSFGSVWDAIEDTPVDAENMKIRSSLMAAIIEKIQSNKWTQVEAARRLGITQPRVSDMMRGKIELFSVDSLIAMAGEAGLSVRVKISKAA